MEEEASVPANIARYVESTGHFVEVASRHDPFDVTGSKAAHPFGRPVLTLPSPQVSAVSATRKKTSLDDITFLEPGRRHG